MLIHRLADALEANGEELLFLAERMPEWMRRRVFQRPDVFRAFASCDDRTLDHLIAQIEKASGERSRQSRTELAEIVKPVALVAEGGVHRLAGTVRYHTSNFLRIRESNPMSSSKENLPASSGKQEHALTVGNLQLDLTHLPEADRIQLQKKAIEGQIDLQKKIIELGLENQAIDKRIGDMTDKVATATKDGTSATVTGSYNDTLGRTEVIMGNTETAAKGKLTRSQTGEQDMTLWYVGIAAAVIVIVALIMR